VLSRYVRQIAPAVALLIVALALVIAGVGIAGLLAIPALLWIAILVINMGPV
jgi:hypothetical protein